MAPPLYGGGYARTYVHGASFCILRVEWHRPCMGAVMPGCMSVARRSGILHFEWHRPCMGAVMPGCMSVARHSTSDAMSVSFHPWKDALNGPAPVWGWLCPDVCPWRVVLHLTL